MRRRPDNEQIDLGQWDRHGVDRMLAAAGTISCTGSRIEVLSRQFLGVPYGESTLIGNEQTPEVFTINLGAVDCFTYLDYVEAMRRSDSFPGFKRALKMVRYLRGKVDYRSRNHFFTDWIAANPLVRDVTVHVGRERTKIVRKKLNDPGHGMQFVPGIPPLMRIVTYIPGSAIDADVVRRLKNGDYVGIYSRARGLDVSHVGIVIRLRGRTLFRHASSSPAHRRVVEEDLLTYAARKPGIVVLRPKPTARPLGQ